MFGDPFLINTLNDVWKKIFLTCPQAMLLFTDEDRLVAMNDAAKELLGQKSAESETLAQILSRLPLSLRELIKPQKISIPADERDFVLVYLHDCRNEAYSQRLLSFFATTLKSLDKPSYVSTDSADLLADASYIVLKDMADWCRIDMRADQAMGESFASHTSKALEAALLELKKLESDDLDSCFSSSKVIRSGVGVFVADAGEELLHTLSENSGRYALMQKVGLRSYICVPIKRREDTIGSLTMGRGWSSDTFDSVDLLMAEEFATKLGVYLEMSRLYANLAEMKNMAESANRAKTNFLANVSHEIRTPVGAILGFSELLISTPGESMERNDWGQKIRSNGAHLVRIIDDILDLSKVEIGKLDLEIRKTDLHRLLKEIAAFATVQVGAKKGLQFEFILESALPRFIHTDETRLRQILYNIIGNAIKFTKSGSVRVRSFHSPGQKQLSFEVTDTGIGVDSEQAQLLFQPFSQADTSYTRKFGGTGLGLALSRNLAQRLGGNVILKKSQLGQGSVFLITIEAQVSSDEFFSELNSDKEGTLKSHDEDLSGALLNKKILVVEDSSDIQVLLCRVLEGAGASVALADNGEEGLKAAMSHPYDIVLMDVQMPVKDGLEAVREMRASGYQGVVIALTANAMKEEHERCIEAGYDLHLSKPIRRQDLVRRLLEISGQKV